MSNVIRLITVFFFITPVVFSCSEEKNEIPSPITADATECETITAETAADCIHLNQIQVFGTHNSYKLYPHPDLVEKLNEVTPGCAENINYEHRPIREQLEALGVRQLELDIFADPDGGHYAEPVGAMLIGDEEFIRPPEMLEPGFKVMHTQDLDYRTSCFTLKSCLKEARDWSLENPAHLPIMILVEVKQRSLNDIGSISFTEPIPFEVELMHKIDDEIWEIFSRDHVITPDDVRGNFETLEQAVLQAGWPVLRESRGSIIRTRQYGSVPRAVPGGCARFGRARHVCQFTSGGTFCGFYQNEQCH
jgi:hypothetical protein